MSLSVLPIEESLKLRRIYEPSLKTDGKRILVDRLWPRGISKQRANLFLWVKDAAPSADLRRWYHKDLDRWPEFRVQYLIELKENNSVDVIQDTIKSDVVTLIFANANLEQNHAAVLREHLIERLKADAIPGRDLSDRSKS